MRYLRELRAKKGLSIAKLSKLSGVSSTAIWNFEITKTELRQNLRTKIAEILDTTVEEISREIGPITAVKLIKTVDKKVVEKSKKCLNENCPLNKDKKCINDVVLSGKAPCFGKDLVKSKIAALNYRNTKALFR